MPLKSALLVNPRLAFAFDSLPPKAEKAIPAFPAPDWNHEKKKLD
jgi:hypothetical protein